MDISAHAALIIIDVQKAFDNAAYWGHRNNPQAEDNIRRLSAAWRHTGRPIVMVTHSSLTPGSPLAADGPGYELKDVARDVAPALRVIKHVNSSFYGTPDLDAWLRESGISQLVLCGIQTNMCVETTARMAGNLGYDTVVPLDATHTFDLAGPDGGVVSADDLARATAANLHGGGFARVVTTDEIIAGIA